MVFKAGAGPEHLVYLGLGSNLGDRAANLRRGLELLAAGGLAVEGCSRLYQTAPWGGVDQPDFYNLAVAGRTRLTPPELLRLAKASEVKAGRRPTVVWGPRVLDIDILLYTDWRWQGANLTLPHPQMHRRAFVLAPLLELAPGLRVPGWGPAAQLLAELPAAEKQGVRPVGNI